MWLCIGNVKIFLFFQSYDCWLIVLYRYSSGYCQPVVCEDQSRRKAATIFWNKKCLLLNIFRLELKITYVWLFVFLLRIYLCENDFSKLYVQIQCIGTCSIDKSPLHVCFDSIYIWFICLYNSKLFIRIHHATLEHGIQIHCKKKKLTYNSFSS